VVPVDAICVTLLVKCSIYYVMYQTRDTAVFHRDIQTLRRELKILRAAEYFGRNSRCSWIADETLSRLFDGSSQSKQKLRSKRKSKIVKIYAN